MVRKDREHAETYIRYFGGFAFSDPFVASAPGCGTGLEATGADTSLQFIHACG
jgi:hypothetical protein